MMPTLLNTNIATLEKENLTQKVGTLEIVVGPMFSGKTTELLRRLKCESAIGFQVMYINHVQDTRGANFSTHNELYNSQIEGIRFQSLARLSLLQNISDVDIIGIDEAQFFPDLVEEVLFMVEELGKHVIVAGLNGDFRREPFGHILELEPKADSYTRLRSYCIDCSKRSVRTFALFTFRLVSEKEVVLTGGKEEYIPLCRGCYVTRTKIMGQECCS